MTPSRLRMSRPIPSPCQFLASLLSPLQEWLRRSRALRPLPDRHAMRSALNPGLVEMLLQRLVLLAAMHAGAIGAVDRAPVRLDDHARVAQRLLDIRHD